MGDRDPQVVKEGANEGIREVKCEIPGQGMFWEADECGRCVRDVSCSPFLSFFLLFYLIFPLCSFSHSLRFCFSSHIDLIRGPTCSAVFYALEGSGVGRLTCFL